MNTLHLSCAGNVTQHICIYPSPDEQGVTETPTALSMLHSVSSNEKGCLSLSPSFNHRTVPIHVILFTQILFRQNSQYLAKKKKKKNLFNVRIQLLFSVVFPQELSIIPSPSCSALLSGCYLVSIFIFSVLLTFL